MEKGYIKLYRVIGDNELLSTDNTCLVVFIKLLTNANRLTGTYRTGKHRFATLCNLKETTVFDALKRLERATIIRLHADRKATTIHICNWWKYQQDTDRKPTVEVDLTDTKQERERERERKDTNVSLAKTPRYGKPEVNELMDEWEKIVGYKISSKVQNNRNAVNNLLKKYTGDQIKQLISGVSMAQKDKFAPQISDFVQLQSKLNDLMRWGKTKGVTTQKVRVIS